MVSEERNERVAVRMTPTEVNMLSALAEADGISVSDVIRLFVRREYVARFGEKKPAKSKR